VDEAAVDPGVLTGLFQRLYSSAMNDQPDTRAAAVADDPSAAASWTLFHFLDVADSLYGRVSDALGEVELSYAKYEVLSYLRDAGEAVSLGALAVGQNCARSNITQIIDRLETDGLVRRAPDPADRRSVLAELTPAGAILARQGAAQLDRLRTDFATSLGRSDREQLDRLLKKLR
jgi:DNA-binding MarR family transcriptional regulator